MVTGEVVIKLNGLKRFRSDVTQNQSEGPIRTAIRQWGFRYRGAMQERFVRYSRGGGDWPPLKFKRKRGEKKRAAILRDTNTMFGALNPAFINAPGQYQEDIHFGVKVGYGGPSGYVKGKSAATVADVAEFHQTGAGFLPVRKTIVVPEPRVISSMANDMKRALIKLATQYVNQ